ncbi:MAG: DUF779 domain-containing protein [Solirubrobacterales bacterium]
MAPKVTATPQALELIARMKEEHGPLAVFLSGGCCDGSSPICLLDGELPPGPGDHLLGTLDDVPFYIDEDQFKRWREPEFLIDVRPGAAEGFSLSGSDAHLVTSSV